MKKLKIFILVSAITFFLVLIVKAFENPTQNPPLGGGALQIQSNQLLITKPTKVTGTNTFIVEGGNVGIGTTAPGARLDVAGSGGSWTTWLWGKAIELDNANVLKWEANAGGWRHGIGQTNNALYFVRAQCDDNSCNPYVTMLLGDNGNVSISGNVGIGTTVPNRAKLEVAGMVGNTNAILGAGQQGIGIINSWPGVGWNVYWNGGWKSISSGYGGVIWLDPGSGDFRFDLSTAAAAGADQALTGDTKMIIKNNGNVGIGTTAPAYKLHIKEGWVLVENFPADDITPGLASYALRTRDIGGKTHQWNIYTAPIGGGWGVPPLSLTFWEYNDANNNGIFCEAGDICSPRVVIQGKTGNVGIGTTNPQVRLDIQGGWVRIGDPASNAIQFETQSGFHRVAFKELRFWDWDTGGDMVTFNNGNVGIGTTNPRAKLDVAGHITQSACRPGETFVPGGFCIDTYLRGPASLPYAVNDCISRGGRVCTYGDLTRACFAGIKSASDIAAGRWIGNNVGDDQAYCGNVADCANLEGVCSKFDSRYYWCCYGPAGGGGY